MVRIKIAENSPYLEELQYHLAKLGAGSLPGTAGAMAAGAKLIQSRWIDFANGGTLTGVTEPLKRPSGVYARSIKTRATGDFSHEIYSDAKIAEWIENGTDDLDMKTTHPYGPRSRVSKKGVPYLIIPFRWGTPKSVGFKNVMPVNVYGIVKKFKKMKTLVGADKSGIKTPNAQNPSRMVGRAQYNKGYNRLSGADFDGSIEQKTRMDGMVRSTDETGKNRSGGYFTFRIISANSPADSWKRKGMPPRHVTRALAEETRETIEEMVEGAVREDLGL
jgi:hypothetical protein